MKFTYLAVFVALIATATANSISDFLHEHTYTRAEANEIAHKH